MPIETSGELLYTEGYKYLNARPWSVKTPFTGMTFTIPAHDGGAWVALDADGWMHFRAGYAFDGPSGPTRDTPSSMRAAQMHDGCYQAARLGLLDGSEAMREKVDRFFYDLLREDGMWWWRAKAWHLGVRLGSKFAWVSQPEKVHSAPSGRVIEVQPGTTLNAALLQAGVG